MTFTHTCLLAGLLALITPTTLAATDRHDHAPAPARQPVHADDDHHDHDLAHEHAANRDHAAVIPLSGEQQRTAGIQVAVLTPKRVSYPLYAPGELLSNGYTSYRVAPRVASVVLRRHVALGDHVAVGQPLITLFSEAVVQAQAEYLRALPEWRRVQALGQRAVGEQRFVAAKTSLDAAAATLNAYGLTTEDLGALAGNDAGPLGEYTLRASIDGAVLSDHFAQGQRLAAGQAAMVLADETQLWVEAHVPPTLPLVIDRGSKAKVVVGDRTFTGSVSQEAHTIDPQTRTRTIRLLVSNQQHQLHAGMFAEVFFTFTTATPVMAVPETALLRHTDGDWQVYVENAPGEFSAQEVTPGRVLGELREISGLTPGSRVVVSGAFFIASESAKSGFDPHNH